MKYPLRKEFIEVKRLRKLGTWLLWVSTGLSLLHHAFFGSLWISGFNGVILLLFHVVNILTDYVQFRKEGERRLECIDNAYGTQLAENRTKEYHSNDSIELGDYKMVVNYFENCFFSYSQAKQGLKWLWVKTILFSLIFITAGLSGERVLFIQLLQLSVPYELIMRAIRLSVVTGRMEHIFARNRELFGRLDGKIELQKEKHECIRNILDYEVAITFSNFLPSDLLYEKMRKKLSEEWKQMKVDYKIGLGYKKRAQA